MSGALKKVPSECQRLDLDKIYNPTCEQKIIISPTPDRFLTCFNKKRSPERVFLYLKLSFHLTFLFRDEVIILKFKKILFSLI